MPFHPATPSTDTFGSVTVAFSRDEAVNAAEELAYMGRTENLVDRVLVAATESLSLAPERHLALGAALVLHSRTIADLSVAAYSARKRRSSTKLGTLSRTCSDLGLMLLHSPASARIRPVRTARRALRRVTREMLPAGLFETLRTMESEILTLRRSGAFASVTTVTEPVYDTCDDVTCDAHNGGFGD
jgi:hypothetical protein